MLSNKPLLVSLLEGELQLVYVFFASFPVPYVTTNLRTPAKVDQTFRAQSTVYLYGTDVVPESIGIDGLSLTPSKTRLLPTAQRKFKLLHFGFLAQLEAFRGVVIYKEMLSNDDTALPR
jgi:hypothetical protein